jgi:ACR3 family arsenite efflux pump ArsB
VTRLALEKNQLFIYLAALSLGLILGLMAPEIGSRLEIAIWPLLGVLLYSTFTQVPLTHLREAFSKPQLLCAAIVGNFIIIPMVVVVLLLLAPNDAAVRLGIFLVLIVPCTDWFITFTQLGGGDTNGAIAFSPISLLMQMLLLPFYLWLLLGNEITLSLAQGEMVWAFIGLIMLPLLLAWISQIWAENHANGEQVITILGWFPVMLLAAVIFIITTSQVGVVIDSVDLLGNLLLIFVLFLVISAGIAKLLSRLFQLSSSQGRVLAFSFGTRNSFVMLPLALALPTGYELTAVVIVFQSIIELIGMMVFLWWVPKHLFPLNR